MARSVSQLCPACGRRFAPDRFNEWHQKGCGGAECRQERKRARDRERYRRKYKADADFRESEKRRRAECRRQAKARGRAVLGAAASGRGPPTGGAALEPEVRQLRWALTGMAAQLAGEGESGTVGALLSGWAERGRELEREARSGP